MAVFNVKKVFEDEIRSRFNFDFDLKNEQISIIESVLEKNHTVGVFPTGFGKSICLLLPPLILDQQQTALRHICLVISPLKSLMLDQCKKNSEHGIAAAVVKGRSEMSPDVVEGIKKSDYSVLYMSPETLLDMESWGHLILNSRLYQDLVTLIAIDEAHILKSWGDTFRPTFARLGELRSHFPRTPFLMLTATCTQQIIMHITSRIHLPGLKMHIASPDRPNIYLEYRRSKNVFELDWLFTEIKEKGVKARKTLIYVRSLSHGGQLYRDILGHMRDCAFLDQQKVHHNSHIALYHAGMANKNLKYILNEISKPDSVIRLAICTNAFGMAINIPDIDLVIHWGACNSVMDFWQEVGRAGRDGRKAKALYFVTPGSILHVTVEMKELCKAMDKGTSRCFRDSILSCFIGYTCTSKPLSPCKMKCTDCDCRQCNCCQMCHKMCPCRKD